MTGTGKHKKTNATKFFRAAVRSWTCCLWGREVSKIILSWFMVDTKS